MGPAPALSPELTNSSIALTRALSAAARNWTLYPPDHPAVGSSVSRLADAVRASTSGGAFTFGVTPQTLLVGGLPLPADQTVAETARLLHDRDILQITFIGDVPLPALHATLTLLGTAPGDLRDAGGPAAVWDAAAHPTVVIEPIDYGKILEDRDISAPLGRRDDVWRSIVNQVAAGGAAFDERQQQRLLEIAGSVREIVDLVGDAAAPKCTPDGAPIITAQAATVLAVFRHLASLVNVVDPGMLPEVMRNIAAATAQMDANVVMQLMQSDDAAEELPLVARIARSFDDETVAQMLASAMSRDGRATARLAQVFETIAPDEARKRRVLRMTRSMLSETDFGRGGQFGAAWESMEQLLVGYNEAPFVPGHYQAALAGAGTRSEMFAARDVPPEWAHWVDTLKQDNVRSLSVLLVSDLLRLEDEAGRAAEIAADLMPLAEDLLLSGAFADLLVVVTALRDGAERPAAPAPAACRAALTAIAESMAMREVANLLGELEESSFTTLAACCAAMGPAAIRGLQPALEIEDEDAPAWRRAGDIVRGYGDGAAGPLAAMTDDSRPFVVRTAAALLGQTRSPEAVPPLQALLRRHDPGVLRAAVSALAAIDDPAAARAIQTVLRATRGEEREAVVEALVAGRDARVVPMLARILADSDPFGPDHRTVLDALGAVQQIGDDRAVPPVAAVMRRTRLFAWRRARAVKRASVEALRAIGGARARSALEDAARNGDRMLRRILRQS